MPIVVFVATGAAMAFYQPISGQQQIRRARGRELHDRGLAQRDRDTPRRSPRGYPEPVEPAVLSARLAAVRIDQRLRPIT